MTFSGKTRFVAGEPLYRLLRAVRLKLAIEARGPDHNDAGAAVRQNRVVLVRAARPVSPAPKGLIYLAPC